MNLDFSEDQKLLQKTARDFLAERSPLQVDRDVLEKGTHGNAELWKAAAEMGWQGAVIPEEYGGAGFGYLELVLIAQELGRALAPISVSPTKNATPRHFSGSATDISTCHAATP